MDFEGVKEFVLDKLNNELSSDLHYHSLEHTLDVLEAAARLAELEGVNGHDFDLLKTAVLFHDLGFIVAYEKHEQESVKLAYKMLPDFGCDDKDLAKIKGMVMTTEIPQSPNNLLEEIIADADLDYLGRDDVFLISQRLQYEWKLRGMVSNLREWHEKQLSFMKNHSYHTASAKKLRNNKKMENIREIEDLLNIKK